MQGRPLQRPAARPFNGGPIAAIILLGLATYWTALRAPFIWDDTTAILQNPTIQGLLPVWRPWIPPLETPVARRPLVNVSFAVNYALDGFHPTAYHASNLALHIIAALLLFAVVRRTLQGERLRARFGADSTLLALIASVAWLVHPLCVEVVAYATQRTESMMGCFLLLTLYGAIRSREPGAPSRWQRMTVTACVCGMASKESMAVAPLVVALYDRVFLFDSLREMVRARRRLYAGLALTWGVLGLLLWLRPHSTVGLSTGVSPLTYALNQAQIIPHYLRLALWPDALVLDYGLPRPLTIQAVSGGIAVMAALVAATAVALVRWPAAGFPCAVFFLTLMPTSSVIPIATEVGAERRMYLPLAALVVLAVTVGYRVVARSAAAIRPRRRATVRAAAAAMTIACIAVLAIRSARRSDQFSSAAIWRSSVEHRPNGRARASYATALLAAGDSDAAVAQIRLATADFPPAHAALGNELAAAGRYEEAARELRLFIDAAPAGTNRLPVQRLLGDVLLAQGRFAEGAAIYESTLAVARARGHDTDWQRLLTLAKVYVEMGQPQRAVPHARAAARRNPDDASAQNILGIALAADRQLLEARDRFRLAVRLAPTRDDVRANLARTEALLRPQ